MYARIYLDIIIQKVTRILYMLDTQEKISLKIALFQLYEAYEQNLALLCKKKLHFHVSNFISRI